jgi:undecaprenyl-diphosphatase
MSDGQVIVLALIQGVTEFFPVSSSGHLILARHWFGFPDGGTVMDVAFHLGTLGALLVYFFRDVKRATHGVWDLLRGQDTKERTLLLTLSVATVPLVFVGFGMDRLGSVALRSLPLLGWSSLVFGLLMYGADVLCPSHRPLKTPPLKQAFWGWGWAQTLAFVHGASRSGVCLTYGRLKGYRREDCARFAFLMAIPALGAASCLKVVQFWMGGDWTLLRPALLGILVSLITGLGVLGLFMLWLRRFSLKPFALYRILLGLSLLALT